MMIASIRFLHATIVHKYHVYCAGRRLGVSRWQLLIHDLDKFLPRMFVPYGRFFYALPGADWLKAVIDKSAEARLAMSYAWLRHVQTQPHHWQYFVLVNGASVVAVGRGGATVDVPPLQALPMPRKYVREMLADWMGAGRAYDGKYPDTIETWKWWQENKDQLVLHPTTRQHLTNAIYDWFQPNDQPGEHILHGTWISHEELVWGKPS
jgi:hypothetical protein